MPTTSLPIPINGFSDSMNHQKGADGFTTSAENVFPNDNLEHRRRVGTRQGFQAIADMGASDAENVQLMLDYQVYRAGNLVQEVLIVAGSNVWYAPSSGETTAIGYGTDLAVGSVTFTGVPTADDTIALISTDLSTETFTAKTAETLASQQFNMTTANAIATFTFGEDEFDDTTTATTIQLIDGEGSPTTKTYTLVASGATAPQFNRGANANACAENFKAVVEGADGHNGTILVIKNSTTETDGKVTIVQKTGGTAGNTTITDGAGWLTICSVNPPAAFAGGAASATATTVADSLQRCIEYSTTNDLYEKITVANDSAGKLTLTQATTGADGNSVITPSSGLAEVTVVNFAGSGVLAAEQLQKYDTVRGVQMENHVYLVNGRHYYKIDLSESEPKIIHWSEVTTTSSPTGLPKDTYGNRCPLITSFGGRIVLAGLPTSQTNWFMSKLGDPLDWTNVISAAHTAQAGGTSTSFGKLGEPIITMFPFGESGLLLAGNSSLTYMTTDPVVSGAQFVRMSNSVGVKSVDAWCQGPEKTCFIVSDDGVYQVQPNQFNIQRGQNITSGRLDGFFGSLADGDVSISLAYDPPRTTVMMFVNRPDDPIGMEHYQLHVPTGSWWKWTSNDIRMDTMTTHCFHSPYGGERKGVWYGYESGRICIQPNSGVVPHDGGGHVDPLKASGNNSPNLTDHIAFTSKLGWSPINSGMLNERMLITEIDVAMDVRDFPQPSEVTTVNPTLYLYGGDTAQTLTAITDDITVTETVLAIEGGTVTGGTEQGTIDGGSDGDPLAYADVSPLFIRRSYMTVTCVTPTSLNGLTLIFTDSDGTAATLLFDNTIGMNASHTTSATAVTCGIEDAEGDKFKILSAIKISLDLLKGLAGAFKMTAEEPNLADNTIVVRSDETTGSSIALTGTAYDPQFTRIIVALSAQQWVSGGIAAPLAATYSLVDDTASDSQKQWQQNGWRVRRIKSTDAGGAQWLGYWGFFEVTDAGAQLFPDSSSPRYISTSSVSTIPESTFESTEIHTSPDLTESTLAVDTDTEESGKATLASWTLTKGRNNRMRTRQRQSDFQLEIQASGTSWVLEDIAANIEPGGKYRSVLAT